MTPEQKRRISEGITKTWQSPEVRKKREFGARRRWYREHPNDRPVVCGENLMEEFDES